MIRCRVVISIAVIIKIWEARSIDNIEFIPSTILLKLLWIRQVEYKNSIIIMRSNNLNHALLYLYNISFELINFNTYDIYV